jgi:hypothetical protein
LKGVKKWGNIRSDQENPVEEFDGDFTLASSFRKG